MVTRRTQSKLPDSVGMVVRMFRGVPMLVMVPSQGTRAATRLRAEDLPVGTQIFLRKGQSTGLPDEWAEVVIAHHALLNQDVPFNAFKGTSPSLVLPERALYLLAPKAGEFYARQIDVASALVEDDRLDLNLRSNVVPETQPPARRDWTAAQWFERATERSPEAAFEARNAELADELIRCLFTEDELLFQRVRSTILGRARKAYAREPRRCTWQRRILVTLGPIDASRNSPHASIFADP